MPLSFSFLNGWPRRVCYSIGLPAKFDFVYTLLVAVIGRGGSAAGERRLGPVHILVEAAAIPQKRRGADGRRRGAESFISCLA